MTDIRYELAKIIDTVDERDWQNIFPEERDEIVAVILQRFDVTPKAPEPPGPGEAGYDPEVFQAYIRRKYDLPEPVTDSKYVSLSELADIVEGIARFQAGGYPDSTLLKLAKGLREAS